MAFSKQVRARYADLVVFMIAEDKLAAIPEPKRSEIEVQLPDGEWYRPFRFNMTDEESFDTSDD